MIVSLPRYRIIEKLGAGGMGEVYKAEDTVMLRTVAIKVLAKHVPRAPDAEVRFLREARITSQINHPHIITIYEVGETAEHAYIVMEYVEGRSLRSLIQSRSLGPADAMRVALEICDALEEAHARGVIHRDIKPENILLNERGQVKVLDFGLARRIGDLKSGEGPTEIAERLTASGTIMGTLSYMSPEQLRGHELDERTDIFSFGILLYEMIAGKMPFEGASPVEMAASILKDDAVRIKRLPPGLPRGTSRVVKRCLEKDKRRRYTSFSEVKHALSALGRVRADRTGSVEKATALPSSLRYEDELTDSVSPPQFMNLRPTRPTILVLPLQAVGGKEENAFIGIGLAHAITTDLAKINGLSVLSKAAGAGRIDEAGQGADKVARELGATILLEGEVVRSGQMMSVMARLTDVETGRVIWGGQYRGDASDLFSIQDALCEGVAGALQISISNEARRLIARPATTSLDAFEYYSKGRSFLERHDIEANVGLSAEMFKEALSLDPEFALAYAGLGEAYWLKYVITHDSQWVERAIAASDRALVLDPHQAQVHTSLGIIYHGTGKIEQAIEEFERAIQLQPLNDDAHRWLGRCYAHRGEIVQAEDRLKKAIEIRPGYWDNYNMLGICYFMFSRYNEAAEQFRRVIAIQPDNFYGYNQLGAMYFCLGRYRDAVAMLQKAIAIYPDGSSYSNLGTAYFYLGRYEDAVAAYKSAIKLDPRNDVLYRNLGDAYSRVGGAQDAQAQYATAIELLSEHLSVNPDDALRLGDLAICYAKLNNEKRALSTIERANALEPHNTNLMYEKAVVYALTGHGEEAVDYLEQALDRGYSRSEAERDPDLESLRAVPAYRALFPPQTS